MYHERYVDRYLEATSAFELDTVVHNNDLDTPSTGGKRDGFPASSVAEDLNQLIKLILRGKSSKQDLKLVIDKGMSKSEKGGDLVNALCFEHAPEGRTPLAYAVAKNDEKTVRHLVELCADLAVVMAQWEV
jgi:hypothetical protein